MKSPVSSKPVSESSGNLPPRVDAPGVVLAIDGSHAIVRMDEVGCGRCHEPGGCGGQNIGKMFDSQPRIFRIENAEHACTGDRVTVVVDNDVIRRGALFAYGFPFLALFLGAFAGHFIAGETGSIIGAIAGVFGAWMGLPQLELLVQKYSEIHPKIKR